MSQNDETSQGAIEQAIDKLRGPSKWIARRLLKGSFISDVDKALTSQGSDRENAIKRLMYMAIQKVTNQIRRRVATVPTVIVLIVVLLALIIGNNIVAPLVVAVILITITWLVTIKVFNGIARKTSDAIYKAIEGAIAQTGHERQ